MGNHKLFELASISEKPEIFGAYICMNKSKSDIFQYFYDADGWHFDEGYDIPELWFRPINNIQTNGHSFIQYHPNIILPDGIYNGKYNKEPAIIRIEGGRPIYVSFIGFLDVDGNSCSSAIFNENGIIASSVEILLKSQVISEECFINS